MFPTTTKGDQVSGRYTITVRDLTVCDDEVLIVRFERPAEYAFTAGQWFRLTLKTEQGPVTKTFSHASAPDDDWLEMATRISNSAFKRELMRLKAGDQVEIVGPGGRLSIPADARRVAFLVGGVGITPVRGLLRDARHRHRVFDDAVVFYGDRDERCITYLDDLREMHAIGVRVVPVVERAPEGWPGPTGFITRDVVEAHVDLTDGRPVVVAGPPVMVEAMSEVLDTLGVESERRIVERFGL